MESKIKSYINKIMPGFLGRSTVKKGACEHWLTDTIFNGECVVVNCRYCKKTLRTITLE
jgi:hypothetical protein